MRKIKRFFQDTKVKKILSFLAKEFCSALIGFFLGLLFTNTIAFSIMIATVSVLAVSIAIIVANRSLQFDLLTIIKEEKEKGHWLDIIRIVYPISRELWISGRYNLRILFGEAVVEAINHLEDHAIIKINDKEYQKEQIWVSTLIDDLGWTRFFINQPAENNIKKGIEIADKNALYELSIKGRRHLIGVYSSLGQDGNVEKMFDEIETLKVQLNEEKKKELTADLLRSRAICFFQKKDWAQSVSFAEDAMIQYQELNNHEKYVEIIDLIAEGFLNQKNWTAAEKMILLGIKQAKEFGLSEKYISLTTLYFKLNILKIKEKVFTEYEITEEKLDDLKRRFLDIKASYTMNDNEQLLYNLNKSYKELNVIFRKTMRKKKDTSKKGIRGYN